MSKDLVYAIMFIIHTLITIILALIAIIEGMSLLEGLRFTIMYGFFAGSLLFLFAAWFMFEVD